MKTGQGNMHSFNKNDLVYDNAEDVIFFEILL